MSSWTINDIPWERFDRSKVRTETLSLVKAACMVEHNSEAYARYLCEVFAGDEAFCAAAHVWALEEVQHGIALRRWVELADTGFDFNNSFHTFTHGHQLPTGIDASVRGSRVGELIARCVVETGTSTYYTAIKEYTEEPVLKTICHHIAADEFRHYQLFYRYLKQYRGKEAVGLCRRMQIAIARIAEIEDDELAFAFFTAQRPAEEAYDHQHACDRYFSCVGQFYEKRHIERMSAMILKAIGLTPNGWMHRLVSALAWRRWQSRINAAQIAAFAT